MSTESEKQFDEFLAGLPAPIHKPTDCRHLEFGASCAIQRLVDTAQYVAELRVVCLHCHEPMRFLGLTPGLSFVEPSCSVDGLEALLPMQPEVEKRLFAGARYVMGPPPETRQ